MASFLAFPSPSSVFSAYASLSASIMLLKSMINQLIPRSIQGYLCSIFQKYFKPRNPSSDFSLIVQEKDGMSINEVYTDAELYLNTIINPETDSLKITKRPTETNFSLKFSKSENVVDSYNGIELKWNFVSKKSSKSGSESDDDEGSFSNEKRSFVLSFDKKHKKMILSSYVPFIHKKVQEIKSQKKILNLHTLAYHSGIIWGSVSLQHPSTFDTLAIDSAMKKAIIDDLDRFVKRKEFYKKVGKAWKRGYLLYGPPGTGKSSLVAAMANYLKFDIYDMELTNVRNNSDLRKLLLRTDNRSILVIEDIDCSIKIPNRADPDSVKQKRHPIDQTFTLSGLLNFIDGLWSSCGVERIIIFTTNNKEKLDPALLRPGRMDMHIHMSYLTADGFRLFAKNYLNIQQHWRFEEIEELIKKMNVTPAEVAEELMKSDDADISLEGLVHFLKNKKNTENDHKGKDVNNDEEIEQSKGEIGNNDDDDDENYVANDNGLLETDQSSDESFSE